MARLDIVRKATACAVLAAIAVAGCSAGQSSPVARLAPGTAVSPGGAGHSPGATGSAGGTGAATAPVSPPSAGGSATGGSAGGGSATAPARGTQSATPAPVASNITIAPAGNLRQGPMTITPVYCGKLSAAQRARFGTTAAGGLIYKYANGLSTASGSAKLYVGFTAGGSIAGSNYAGTLPNVAPGKSGEGEVDAVGIEGQDLSFTGCEIMSYALVTPTGVDPVSYAG